MSRSTTSHDLIGPRHPNSGQLKAGFNHAFTGTQNGRDSLIWCAGGIRKLAATSPFDHDAIRIFSLDQDQRHRSRCHRHPEHAT